MLVFWFIIIAIIALWSFNQQYEHFYEFRVPSSLNKTIVLQLSDKNMDAYFQNNHIFTPPYENVVCK